MFQKMNQLCFWQVDSTKCLVFAFIQLGQSGIFRLKPTNTSAVLRMTA